MILNLLYVYLPIHKPGMGEAGRERERETGRERHTQRERENDATRLIC